MPKAKPVLTLIHSSVPYELREEAEILERLRALRSAIKGCAHKATMRQKLTVIEGEVA